MFARVTSQRRVHDVYAHAMWAKARTRNRMATSRPRMYTVHRREYGTLYICHSAVMDGEARTSAAIYFHANNARVNRRGSGREHAHSRLPVPTLKQHLTPESRVPSPEWTTRSRAMSWRTANEISRERRRETSHEENTRGSKG